MASSWFPHIQPHRHSVSASPGRSPVFSHLSSSLQGLWTIRAYKAEERFQELFDAHQDLHSGLYVSRNSFKECNALPLLALLVTISLSPSPPSPALYPSLASPPLGHGCSHRVSCVLAICHSPVTASPPPRGLPGPSINKARELSVLFGHGSVNFFLKMF